MDRPAWAPESVDMQQASPARMYDALLGGSHNFEIDRKAADAGKQLVPDLPRLALSNRAFLRRAVTRVGIHFRSKDGIAAMFDQGELVEPGVVELLAWRPESERDLYETPGRSLGLAGFGRKV